MLKYTGKRLLMLIPVILGITIFVYFIMALSPGDAAVMILGTEATEAELAAKRTELGLDQPVVVQYLRYMKNLLTGDFGRSWLSNASVLDEFVKRLPNTLIIGIFSTILSAVVGISLGLIAAIKQHTAVDYFSLVLALLFCCLPAFWLGLLLQVLFCLNLRILPATGSETWQHFVLPVLVIGAARLGSTVRMTRSSMLEVMSQDYVRTSKAKGASSGHTIRRHVLRNGMLPVVTQVGASFAHILGGSMVTETVFSIAGVGTYMTSAVKSRDIPVVMGVLIFFAITTCIFNLLTDLVYAWVDPRVKL